MDRAYRVWIDASGFTRLCLYNTVSGISAFQVYLAAASNADFLNQTEGPLIVNSTPAPTSAQYAVVADSAVLVFQDAAGDLVSIQIPAPKSTIFLADQVTVDPTAVALLTAACIGNLTTSTGSPVTAFVGGFRRATSRENYS